MIVICEPQCIGFEHSEFNAALIKVIRYAYNDKILFLAENEHLNIVKKLLEETENVEYEVINVPPRNYSNIKRFYNDYKLVKKVYNLADNIGSDKVLFCSITSPTLISIKILLRRYNNIKSIIVPHTILEFIYKRIPFLPTETIFWFRFWVSFFNLDRLKYLVLSPSIKKELIKEIPKIKNYVKSIDHPYIYKDIEISQLSVKKTVFGFIGAGSYAKGIDKFIKLGNEVKYENTQNTPKFIVIGNIMDNFAEELPFGSVQIPSMDSPLCREEFENYIKNIDYAVFSHRKNSYRLVASGALLDAFSYLKPVIALKNPLFEYYFNKMGDIGYLCENYEEMKNLIVELLNNPPKERYISQQKNILKGRKMFDLKEISLEIKQIWL